MIGVFDSGYGGLSVFAELSKRFPDFDFMYLGDNGRAPYGSRSKEIITQYTKEAIAWLLKHDVSLIVLACNTASSQALPLLRKEGLGTEKVLGVVEPIIKQFKERKLSGPVGVIATKATVRSKIYSESLCEANVSVFEQACPLLVPLIEEGITDGPIVEAVLRDYLAPLLQKGIKTLILGCTHYYFLKNTIAKIAPQLSILDASSAVPEYLEEYLKSHPLIAQSMNRGGTRTFFTTDEKDDFARFVERHLGIVIEPVRITL